MNKESLTYVGRQFLLVFIVLLLAVIVFLIGLTVGYGVIGDGKDALSILSLDKWQEIISKFTGK